MAPTSKAAGCDRTSMAVKPARGAFLAGAIVFLAGVVLAAHPGGDFNRYREWGEVAISGNIFGLSGQTVSPFGVPFSLWAHGTGFVFAAVQALLLDRLDTYGSALVVGAIAGVVFWVMLYHLLARAGRSFFLTLF